MLMIRITASFGLGAWVLCVASFVGFDARAQTATNLKCNGCVGTSDLADKSVTSRKVGDGQIKPVNLAAGAQPGGAGFSERNGPKLLGPTPGVLRQVVIRAPADGIVVANAGGNPYFSANAYETIYCGVTRKKNNPIDYADEIITAQTGNLSANDDTPLALVRGFKVKKGKIKIFFLCKQIGGNSNVFLHDPVLVAFFVPGKYGTAVSE